MANVLVPLLRDGRVQRPADYDLGLAELADDIGMALPAPVGDVAGEAYDRAVVRFRDRGSFEVPREPIPADVSLTSWSAAVVVGGGDAVAFVPDDDARDPAVLVFTRVGDLPGRLQFGLPDEIDARSLGFERFEATEARFQASLRCYDADCFTDDDCGGCCGSCRCRERPIERAVMALRCGCLDPAHRAP